MLELSGKADTNMRSVKGAYESEIEKLQSETE